MTADSDMISSRVQKLLIYTGLVLLIGITSSYYLWHKPFSPELVLALGGATWKILASGGIVLLSGALGAWLVRLDHLQALVRLFLQASLGLGILSLITLLVGATLGFHSWFFFGMSVLGILFLAKPAWKWLMDWKEVGLLWRGSGRLGRTIGVGTALILLLTLLTALAPPLKFDSLVYHLALPQIYLDTGRLVYVPEIMFWGMPQLGEMLYTWAAALGGVSAGAVLGWWSGLLTLVGLFGFVQANLGLRPAWVCLAALLSGFTLATSLGWGYVDWFTVLYGLVFLITQHYWRSTGLRTWLLFSGLAAGFAFGVKYTAGVLFIAGLWAVFGPARLSGTFAARVKDAFEYSAAAALTALPWLAKNWIATGNPFYPLFFSAGAMDALRLELYQGGEAWGGWQDVLFLPLRATLMGVELAPGYSASIGPLLLGLGLFATLPARSSRKKHAAVLYSAAWVALPVLLIWAVAGRFTGYLLQTRLYFCIFSSLALLAAGGYRKLAQYSFSGVRFGRIANALILLVFCMNLVEVSLYSLKQGAYEEILGIKTDEDYIAANLGWYGQAMKAVRDLPEGSRTLMLWETRSLNCLPGCEPDEVIDRWLHDLNRWGTPDAVLDGWRNEGFTHLLFYKAGANFLRQGGSISTEDWQALDRLTGALDPAVPFGDAYMLYTLTP